VVRITVYEWFAIGLACCYGGISAWSGVMQLTRSPRMIPGWSAVGTMLIGICLAAAALMIIPVPSMSVLVIAGLLLLHVLAVVNGLHMYGRIHVTHHMIRFILSSIITVFLVL
jgi:hypothetical protein